jgi:hypothetical protein
MVLEDRGPDTASFASGTLLSNSDSGITFRLNRLSVCRYLDLVLVTSVPNRSFSSSLSFSDVDSGKGMKQSKYI